MSGAPLSVESETRTESALSASTVSRVPTQTVGAGGHVHVNSAANSRFLRLVQQQAHEQTNTQFCAWLDEKLQTSDSRTFGEIWDRAGAVANTLAHQGVVPGDRVILCFSFGLDFLDSFIGCLRLAAIAVPVYPPNPATLDEGLKKLALLVADCSAKFGLMDKTVQRLRTATRGWPSGIKWIVPKIGTNTGFQSVALDTAKEEDVAFLQYTSGSTGDPKGVMLSFGNIYSNLQISDVLAPVLTQVGAVGCSWLPQFHDMGLLFCALYPLARGRQQFFLSPTVFIKQPVLWMQAMSQYNCSWTIAPNFAYGLSARKFREMPAAHRPKLDLSKVLGWGNAAEPVRVQTMRDFLESFREAGVLDGACFFASYGLAEHTGALDLQPRCSLFSLSLIRCDRKLAQALHDLRVARRSAQAWLTSMAAVGATSGPHSLEDDPALDRVSSRSGQFVYSGILSIEKAAGRQLVDVRIVADGETEVEEGKVGEIWLRSASCGLGYWRMPEKSEQTFRCSLQKPLKPYPQLEGLDAASPPLFLRTGDEGFIEVDAESGQERLFVCGRAKDVIVIRGKNIFPQDVELSAERASQGQLRLNCSAAFQSQQPDASDLEAADLVCEVKTIGLAQSVLAATCDRISTAVRSEHSLRIRRLCLIRPRSIPKTTSGKIRRKETRRALDAGELVSKVLMVWEDVSVEATEGSSDPDSPADDAPLVVSDHSLASFQHAVILEVCAAAGCEADDIDTSNQPLAGIGLESIAVAELTHRLSMRLGVEVPPEEIINAQSVLELAQRLHTRHLHHDAHADDVDLDVDVDLGVGGQHNGLLLTPQNAAVRPLEQEMTSPQATAAHTASARPSYDRTPGSDAERGPDCESATVDVTSRASSFRQLGSSVKRIFSPWGQSTSVRHPPGGGRESIHQPETNHSDLLLSGMPKVGALGLGVRVLVQVLLIFSLLTSIYLCAVPAVLVMERITNIQIFPLALFRFLIEPTLSSPAIYSPWGDGNLVAVSDVALPQKPMVSTVFFAVPAGLICAAGTFMVCFCTEVVLLKWLLLGRVREGQYPLWGLFYWRRWLVHRHIELLMLVVSPVLQDAAPLSVLYTLLGATIGARSKSSLFPLSDVDFDLLYIGPKASISGSASLSTAVVSGATLHLGSIRVGEACDIGEHAFLGPGSSLPKHTKVTAQTVVSSQTLACGTVGTTLGGRPATVLQDEKPFAGCTGSTVFDMVVTPTAWLLCVLLQAAVCVTPVVMLHELGLRSVQLSALATVCVAVADLSLYLASLCAFTLMAKWTLLGRRLGTEARVPKHSALEVARECVMRLQGLVTRFVLAHCWGGACSVLWYRAMGARVGHGAIFSVGVSLSDWDSVVIGAGCMLGGGCTLQTSSSCADSGDTLIEGVCLGEAVTVGSNTVVGAGCRLENRALVTSLSHVAVGRLVPAHAVVSGDMITTSAKRCFVPQNALPRNPPFLKEGAVLLLYAAWTVCAVWGAMYAVWGLRRHCSLPALVLFPIGGGLYQVSQLLLVVLCKRALGRGRRNKDNELELNRFRDFFGLYGQMLLFMAYDGSMLGQLLKGGPLNNLYLRALGAQAHINAFIAATWVFDQEQIEIAEWAAVNSLATLSPHVVLACAAARLESISVGTAATIWPRASLLGRTAVPPGTQVGPLSRMAAASTALAVAELRARVAAAEAEGSAQLPRERVLLGVPAREFVDGMLLPRARSESLAGELGAFSHPPHARDCPV